MSFALECPRIQWCLGDFLKCTSQRLRVTGRPVCVGARGVVRSVSWSQSGVTEGTRWFSVWRVGW